MVVVKCPKCGALGQGAPSRIHCPNCGTEWETKIAQAPNSIVMTEGVFIPYSEAIEKIADKMVGLPDGAHCKFSPDVVEIIDVMGEDVVKNKNLIVGKDHSLKYFEGVL